MNAQERLEYLLSTEFVPITSVRYMSEIRTAAGDAWPLVRLTLESAKVVNPATPPEQLVEARIVAAEISDAINALTTTGMRLDGADRQEMIDQLAAIGGWPDAVRDAIKTLGGTNRPRWQIEGYSSEPTLEQIEAEVLTTEKQEIVSNARVAMAAILQPVQAKSTAVNSWLDNLDLSSKTLEEVQAYCDDLLASDDGNPTQGGG